MDTIDPLQMGLTLNTISKTIGKETYSSGRYIIGPFTSFIRYPANLVTVEFSDSRKADVKIYKKNLLKNFIEKIYKKNLLKNFIEKIYKKNLLKNFIEKIYKKNFIKFRADHYKLEQKKDLQLVFMSHININLKIPAFLIYIN
jgi:hypothetical protein